MTVDSSSKKESGWFERKNDAFTKQHDQPFSNTGIDSISKDSIISKRQSLPAEEHTKLGHERSGTKTIKRWKATRERRDRYTIECYYSLHAKWITSFYDYMQNNRQIVLNCWEKSGITKFLKIYAALNHTGVDLRPKKYIGLFAKIRPGEILFSPTRQRKLSTFENYMKIS